MPPNHLSRFLLSFGYVSIQSFNSSLKGDNMMIGAYAAASGAAILWGASFLLTKITLTQLGPMATAALRWGVATLALVTIGMATAHSRVMLRRALHDDWPTFVGLGLVGVSLFYTLQNVALTYTTSIDVGLIMNDFPILTAVLGVWLLGERFAWRAVGGLVLATVGVTLISLGGLAEAEAATRVRLLGDLLALVATLFGALYIVGGKWAVTTYDPLTVTALAGLFGALLLVPVVAWEGLTLHLSVGVWAALLGLALGSGAAANWLWWYAAQHLPISRAGAFLYITPIVSTMLGVAVLDEPLSVATAAGAGFVIGGVLLVQT
jgi:drug/metabolite transporter (DMT)-like permease